MKAPHTRVGDISYSKDALRGLLLVLADGSDLERRLDADEATGSEGGEGE